jgi:hypothetical protein
MRLQETEASVIPFCEWCDNPFTPLAPGQIACSFRCAAKLARVQPATSSGQASRSGRHYGKSHAGGVAEGKAETRRRLAETRKKIMDMLKGKE